MADGRVIIDTRLDTSGVEKGLKQLGNLLKGGLAMAGISSLSNAVKAIADETGALNDSVRMASTLFGDYNVDINELTKNIQRLSVETQTAASDLGMGLYNALSSGVPASDNMAEALEFVEKNAIAAKAGMADLDSTIRASASVMNAYGMSVEETDRILGIMMNTQNLGITTIGELSTTLAQVIPTAAAFGVSFEQVGAALATMTSMGTQTAQATTGLNNMLSELGRQSQQAYKNLEAATEAAGLGKKNLQELTEEGYSLTDILLLMQDYAEKNGKTLVDMFGSIEGGRAALQLITQEGEKYNKNLESMADTSGMVEEAGEKVMTQTQELGLAIKNAASAVGNALLPMWNSLASKMSDTLNTLSGNKTAATELESALENLVSATDNYRKAQEDAKGSTDSLTRSMLDQSAAAAREAARAYVEAWNDAEDKLKKLQDDYNKQGYANYSRTLEENEKALNEMAVKYTHITDDIAKARDRLAEMVHDGLLDDYVVSDFEGLSHGIAVAQQATDGYTKSLEDAKRVQDEALSSLVQYYAEGKIDISAFRDTNYELYQTVRDLGDAYNEGYNRAKNMLIPLEDMAALKPVWEAQLEDIDVGSERWYKLAGSIAYATETLKSYNAEGVKNEDKGSSDSVVPALSEEKLTLIESVDEDKVGKALGQLSSDTRVAGGMFTLMGDETQYVKGNITALEGAIENLLEAGLKPADPIIQNLNARLQMFNGKLEELGGTDADDKVKTIDDVMAAYNDTIDHNLELSKVFGDEFGLWDEQISATESAIRSLIDEFDLDAESEEVRYLTSMLEELKRQSQETSTEVVDNFADLKAAFSDAFSPEMFGNLLADSFGALGDVLEETSDRVADLKAENTEMTDKLAEAQAELADAQARGDADAIARQQEIVDSYNEIIEANKAEIKSLESGAEGWKAFGKSALTTLAEVVEGLAAQLAAQAVSALLTFNFGGAAAATAASAVAFAAAAGLRSVAGSFEEGGIVPQVAGVPATGDHLTARVNAGELILNRAQQENLAAQIAAQDAQRQMFVSSGGVINISLAGSNIYGLDAPAVGRAVYENIRNLQYEGVLPAWPIKSR